MVFVAVLLMVVSTGTLYYFIVSTKDFPNWRLIYKIWRIAVAIILYIVVLIIIAIILFIVSYRL